jgi:hypothetical protein
MRHYETNTAQDGSMSHNLNKLILRIYLGDLPLPRHMDSNMYLQPSRTRLDHVIDISRVLARQRLDSVMLVSFMQWRDLEFPHASTIVVDPFSFVYHIP